jgi:hypothetical protein
VVVTVNGQSIDYTLETEKTLGEVVAGMEKALNAAQMVVTSLRWGERELATESESAWSGIALESVESLHITARTLAEVERDQVVLIDRYLEQLAAAIDARGPLPAGGPAGFADAAATVRRCLDMSPGSPAARSLGELELLLRPGSAETPATWPQGIRGRALQAVAGLREAAGSRLAEIESPARAAGSAAAALESCSRDLADVSLMLQTGRQDSAMEQVTRFAALLQTALRAAARLRGSPGAPPAKQVTDLVEDMNAVLKQAVEALEARDAVLLGDLLEYEIAPRLKTLSGILGPGEGR